MKKLWMLCGLLMTMVVCGTNQALGSTPEDSDTIFMRFDGNSSSHICIACSKFDRDYADFPPPLVDMAVEIETEQGVSILEKSGKSYWVWYVNDYGLSMSNSEELVCCIDMDSLLMGIDFTAIKIYGYSSGEDGHIPFSIVSLWVTGNLVSLDVSGCSNLEMLNCANCQLTSLNVSGCSALNVLECHNGSEFGNYYEGEVEWGNNRLTSLDVSGCPNLGWLQCHYNQLSSLDVGNCPNLRFLRCLGNQLTSLELGLYHKLDFLDCMDNQLTSLDLYDISNMESCLISGNRISEIRYTGEEGRTYELGFGYNCFPLHKCFELSKIWNKDMNDGVFQGNSQHVPVALDVNEHYDLHADMELDGARTTLRVTRKGGGYLDPKLYSVENDWLSFSEKGEYTVEMTNPKVREYIAGNDYGWPHSTALVTVYLDVRVGMSDDKPVANEVSELLVSSTLQVYPNPATDVLRVELQGSEEVNAATASETLQTVRILSLSGHLYHSFSSGFDNLPVGNLPAGLYLLEAETTNGTVLRQKFVKR